MRINLETGWWLTGCSPGTVNKLQMRAGTSITLTTQGRKRTAQQVYTPRIHHAF
jgi:hypothetical protein